MTIGEFDNFGKVFSHEGPHYLETQANKHSSPMDFVISCEIQLTHSQSSLLELVFNTAGIVEPKDRITGYDPEYTAAHAFAYGGILGLKVAHIFLNREEKSCMTDIAVAVAQQVEVVEGDDNETLHQLASVIVNVSEEGMAIAESYDDLLERWESDICPDINVQRYFRRGFGYVMFLIDGSKRLRQEQDRHRLAHQLDEGVQIDWDAELQKIADEG